MVDETSQQLRDFTQRYCQLWQTTPQQAPYSEQYLGIDSPCLSATYANGITWQPKPFSLPSRLEAVSKGVDIVLQPSLVAFYTTQFAGDMTACFEGMPLTLLQVWNEEDFTLLQQNLVGHLVMKRRLKHSPTLFFATTDDESTLIAVDNLSGNVVLETLGKSDYQVLSPSLAEFLQSLTPKI